MGCVATEKEGDHMHIHSNPMSIQMMALGATQRTQYTVETKRASEVVRKKLTALSAASDDEEGVSRVEAYAEADAEARQKRSQSDPEAFRSVYFSFTV
jgi:hypothetical protein